MTTLVSTFVHLDRAVRAFVREGSGVTDMKVIKADGDGPAPDVVYAGVKLIDDDRVSWPIEVERGDRLDVRLNRQAVFSIQWYRKGANAAARRFMIWAESSLGTVWAQNAKGDHPDDLVAPFALQGYTYREIDKAVSAQEEERVQIDLTVDYWLEASYDMPYIEAIDLRLYSHGRTFQQEIP